MHWLEALIAHYGLLVVLVGSVFEGETVVTFSGFAAHQGLLPPVGVAFCAMAGAFIGDQTLFWLTRSNAERGLIRRLAGSRGGKLAISAVAARPTWFTLGFRFIPGLRTVGPVAIALAGIDPRRFALMNAASAIVWGIGWTCFGYLAGAAAETLLGRLQRFEHVALVGLTILLAVGVVIWTVRHHILRSGANPHRF